MVRSAEGLRWGKWEHDDNDDYAGNVSDAIDMAQRTTCEAQVLAGNVGGRPRHARRPPHVW